jgi:hypothetical protein
MGTTGDEVGALPTEVAENIGGPCNLTEIEA